MMQGEWDWMGRPNLPQNRAQGQPQGGLFSQAMTALGQYGQNAQADLEARPHEAVFAANPEYAAKIYGAPTSQYQKKTLDMALREEQRQLEQRGALAKIAEQIGGGVPTNGQMGPMQASPGESALAKMAAITGDPTALANLIIAREKAASGMEMPSAVREYQYYNSLPKDAKDDFLRVKRAQQYLDIGGGYIAPDQVTGAPVPLIDKTLAPADVPVNAAAKAGAMEAAKLEQQLEIEPQITAANKAAELESVVTADLLKKAKNAENTIDILQKAEILLPKATGSLMGAGRDVLKSAVGISDEKTQANTDLELLSGWLVSNVPRMEGPQSNFDMENYKKMAADLGNSKKPIGDRQAALSTLMSLQAKYADLNKEVAPVGSTPNTGTRKRWNPATGKLE